MKSKDKVYFTIILFGFLIAIAEFIFTEFENWTYFGLWISEFTGFVMLLINGTFIKTKHFKMLKLSISIIILGALFKLMHWPHHGTLLIIGFVSVIGVYILSFINKPLKKRLDITKLFWVIVAYSGGLLSLLKLINHDYQVLSSALMWLATIDYLISSRIQYLKNRL